MTTETFRDLDGMQDALIAHGLALVRCRERLLWVQEMLDGAASDPNRSEVTMRKMMLRVAKAAGATLKGE